MRKTLTKLIVLLALLAASFGLTGGSPVSAAPIARPPVPQWWQSPDALTDCDTAFSQYRSRVCFDSNYNGWPAAFVYVDSSSAPWSYIYASTYALDQCTMPYPYAGIAGPYELQQTGTRTWVNYNYISTLEGLPEVQVGGCGSEFHLPAWFHDILEYIVACYCGYEYVRVT